MKQQFCIVNLLELKSAVRCKLCVHGPRSSTFNIQSYSSECACLCVRARCDGWCYTCPILARFYAIDMSVVCLTQTKVNQKHNISVVHTKIEQFCQHKTTGIKQMCSIIAKTYIMPENITTYLQLVQLSEHDENKTNTMETLLLSLSHTIRRPKHTHGIHSRERKPKIHSQKYLCIIET